DRKGMIIKGHGRYLASLKLGLQSVPVIVANLSDAMAKASRLADNKVAESNWDNDLLKSSIDSLLETIGSDDIDLQSFGFDMSVFDDLIQSEVVEKQSSNYSTVRENKVYDNDDIENVGSDSYERKLDESKLDEVPEIESIETRVKSGDIWQLGKHYLLCGDCTNIIKELTKENEINILFTDPPYGMNLNCDFSGAISKLRLADSKKAFGGNKYENVINDNKDFDPSFLFTIKCKEMFLFGADYFAERLINKNSGSWFVWDKRVDESMDKVYGSAFETCWSLKKHKREIIRCKWAGIFGMENQDTKKRVHPTQKPIGLVTWFLNKFSNENDIVADPFLGSGTTLIACEKTNRICYGAELSPKYCDVILTRWEKLTGNTAILIRNIEE
ncbi:MAG TPA: DNA methyltransferase, partial [Allocoleopsis sp.]